MRAKKRIRAAKALAPKGKVDLDENIAKTKDLKPAAKSTDRPTITAQELQQARTEALLDDKLDEEIQLAKQLLEFESSCEGSAPVQFRLADLYWEKSKRAFFKSQDFSLGKQTRQRYTRTMSDLQGQTVKNYTAIIDTCPDYEGSAKTLFYLGKTLVELGRASESAPYFQRIIKEFEGTQWVAQAWFMIGEYYFNDQGDAHRAYKAYKRAAQFNDSPIYAFAIYKQGWCHINTGDWDLARDTFRRVIEISDDPAQALDAKGRISLRKEALKDYVRAYSHVGSSKRAYRQFLKLGGKDSVASMMEQLGNWLINRDSHREVMVVYKDIIKNFPQSTRLPVYQGRIVNAADKMGNDRETVKQVKVLTKFFRRVRAQIKKNRQPLTQEETRKIQKDIREAEEIAENTIRRLSMEHHKQAKKLPEASKAQGVAYKYAYELYKHYLDVFPEPNPKDSVNYVFYMRYYYAEVLYQLERFQDAAINYDRVVDMNPNPKRQKDKRIVLQAAEDSVRAYDELVHDLDRKNPLKISAGDPKPIPKIKQALIRSCIRYIKYAGKAGGKIVEIRYKMARIYYTYNHFDRAAPAFQDIVDNHPKSSVACYAANLALDIYNGEKNYKALRQATRSYQRNTDLRTACQTHGDGGDFAKFAQIEEQATFELIRNELELKHKYVAAGNAYMDFFRQYGKKGQGKYAIDAVYNAAVNYDKGQRLDKANEVREFLVKTFEKSGAKGENDLVKQTLYNIAQSYERVVDFGHAAQYLETFAKRYPKDKRTKNAVFNAGLYRAMLQDFSGAKAARRKFLRMYPGDDEAHNVKFAMCETAEREAEQFEARKEKGAVKKWEEVHNCYWDWVKNKTYSSRDTDLLCYAQFRRGEIMRSKTRYTKGYIDQRKYILDKWPRWKSSKGVDQLPRCASAVAELMFRGVATDFSQYAALRISEFSPIKKAQVRFKKSIDAKVKARDPLIKRYRDVAKIGVAQWSLAALYMIGEAYHNSIESLLKAPLPKKIRDGGQTYQLTEEDKEGLRAQLRVMAKDTEESAVGAFGVCVETANRLGVYNKWSVKALNRLQSLRPDTYHPLVERVPPVAFLDSVMVVGNGIVLSEGDTYKALKHKVKVNVGVPKKGSKKAAPSRSPQNPGQLNDQKTSTKKNKGKRTSLYQSAMRVAG